MRKGIPPIYFICTKHGIIVPRRSYQSQLETVRAVQALKRIYPYRTIRVVNWRFKKKLLVHWNKQPGKKENC
jgi:hypothetical protein